MNKEFKESLANIYSLFERMDKHLTGFQAEDNKEDYLNEAVNNQSGKLEPNALMTIDADNTNRTRVLKVFVGPLFMPDIKKLDTFDNCDGPIKYNSMNGVIFTKNLPFNKKSRQQSDNTKPNGTQTNGQINGNTPVKKSLLGSLRAKAQANVTEGLLANLKAKAAANQGNNTASANTPTTNATNNKVDNGIMNWINNTFIPAIKSISNNPNYEKRHIDDLLNPNFILQKYLVAPEKNDTNYNEESTEEVKKEVAEAIKKGDWNSIKNIFKPINLEAIVFGNVLSLRNQRMVQRQADEYGLKPGDPDYPTNLYAPGRWENKFKRKVKPDAKYKWFTMSPRMADRGTKVNLGSKGHYDEFGTKLNGFQPAYLYDINDTEPIDPNDPDLFNGELPGIINNFTGELNNAAKKYQAELAAQQQNAMSSEQTALMNEIQSDEGKAKIFNDALLSYAEKNGMNGSITLIDVRKSSNVMIDYAKNIIAICDFILKKMRYSNPSLVEPLKMISAFAIACRTTGAKEVLSLFGSTANDTKSLLSDWDNACNVTLQSVTMIINYMVKYLTIRYAKFNNDDTDDGNNTQPQASASPVGTQSGQLKESKNNDIELLIEELFND